MARFSRFAGTKANTADTERNIADIQGGPKVGIQLLHHLFKTRVVIT